MSLLINKIQILLCCVFVFQLVASLNISIADSSDINHFNHSLQNLTETKGNISGNLSVEWTPLQTIDLTSCRCLPNEEMCPIAITKSKVMEISCPADHNYCCNATKDIKISTEKQNIETPENKKVRIYIPTKALQTAPDDESKLESLTAFSDKWNKTTNSFNNTLKSGKPKLKCRCVPRGKCQEKYINYRFGFDCSYSTVRCCEPATEILQQKANELESSGKIIFAANKHLEHQNLMEHKDSNFDKNYNSPSVGDECFCLPLNRCKTDPNTIGKRRDTLCPYDLIQCCGDLIIDTNDVTIDLSPERERFQSSQPESRVGTGFNLQGQSAYSQPIQLPLLKIPLVNETEEENAEALQIGTSTLAPPPLPIRYYYEPPTYQNGYYPALSAQYQQKNNYPWNLYSGGMEYQNEYPNPHRFPQPQPTQNYNEARSNGKGILETIAGFLG